MTDLGTAKGQIIIDASQVDDAVRTAGGALDRLKSVGTGALLGVGAAAVAGLGLAAKSAIDMNAELETTTLQFGTLMGDADKAEAHVAHLFDFAARTPFETGPIITASRHLQVFGGEALNTEDNLTRIGDTAAAIGAPIEDIGFWVGRAYASIMGGQPFGEAAQNLMQLGAVSPQVVAEMNRLKEAGASEAEIFAVLQNHMDGFSGAMETQAGTWSGLMATMKDTLTMAAAEGLEPFFELAKSGLASLVEWFNKPEVQEGIKTIAENLAEGIARIGEFVTQHVVPFLQEHGPLLLRILAGVAAGFAALTVITTVVGWISGLVGAVTGVIGVFTAAGGGIAGIVAILGGPLTLVIAAVAGAIALLTAAWRNNWGDIQGKTQAVWEFIKPLLQAAWDWLKVNIPAALEVLRAFWVDTVWPAIQSIVEAVWPVIQAIFQALRDFVVDTLIPTLQALYTKWVEEVWPTIQTVLETVWSIIEEIFTELGRWINDNIVPWIEFLHEKWVDEVWPAIQKAIETAWDIIEPIWEALKEWMEKTIPPILEDLKTKFDTIMGAISGAVQPVKDAWDGFVGAVQGFWNWLKNKVFNFQINLPNLPSWAVPGSPLPIHTAWKSFAEDMGDIRAKIAGGDELTAALRRGLATVAATPASALTQTVYVYGGINTPANVSPSDALRSLYYEGL